MKMNNDFAIFIISHGRPDKVVTAKTLKDCNYSGKFYIVIDDTDTCGDQYKSKFENVIVFNKQEIANKTDQADNFNNLRTTTHARNACFEIANNLGLKNFLVLDDDYTSFQFRFDSKFDYSRKNLKNINPLIEAVVNFLNSTETKSIAFSQDGDFFGGGDGTSPFAQAPILRRKCMNSFFCSTNKPFKFVSRLNEDVNTYVSLGIIGKLFFTMSQLSLSQAQTQKTAGGMTEAYLESGTYVKSFYTVMYSPSSVKVRLIRTKDRRLHHGVKWVNTVPLILRESVKKK